MKNGKLFLGGALSLGIIASAPAAFAADQIIITPGQAADKAVTYQQAAPTRLFTVEKATTLAPGEQRLSANAGVGLGMNGTSPGLAGGVNLRVDSNVSPGIEVGARLNALGAGGAANILGNVMLDGKLAWTEFSIGTVPVNVGALATLGALATGGGIGSASVGVGIPLTASLSDRFNLTVTPGVGFGFAAGGLLPGGTTPTASAAGFTPGLGVGIDWMLANRLSLLADGNIGTANGLTNSGNVGLRYGFNDSFAGDLFLGYQGTPVNVVNSINAGTIGVGAFYAF